MNKALAGTIIAFGVIVLVVGVVMPDTIGSSERVCEDMTEVNGEEYCVNPHYVDSQSPNQYKTPTIVSGAVLALLGVVVGATGVGDGWSESDGEAPEWE